LSHARSTEGPDEARTRASRRGVDEGRRPSVESIWYPERE
jgi:hypothetical protein